MRDARVACLFASLAVVAGAFPCSADAPSASRRARTEQLLRQAAFDSGRAPPSPVAVDQTRYIPGEGLARWRTDAFALGATDRLSVSLGGVDRTPTGQTLGAPRPWDGGGARLYEVAYERDGPTFRAKAGTLGFELTPRAGVGVSSAGGLAGAGATIRFGQDLEDQVVGKVTDALGLRTVDGESFGDRGRWYLFAAADGQAVGLNVLRDSQGDWSRAGWSSDPSSLIGEAQVGVGWRRGAVQASFGYLHREIKATGIMNAENTKLEDGAVAFSLSIKPSR